MDLYCPRCGEPWDFECLHEEAQARYGVPYYLGDEDRYASLNARVKNPNWDEAEYGKVYEAVSREFRSKGCEALKIAYGAKCSEPSTETGRSGLTRQEASGVLYDLLGDDMDGAAAMLDDEFGW